VIARRIGLAGVVAVVVAMSPKLFAQWPSHPTPGVPRAADGKPTLDAPTPRTADGKVDFSGIWMRAGGGGGGRGRQGAPPPPTTTADGIPLSTFGEVAGRGFQLPLQPWAADLKKKRMADNSKDNPDAHCLPMGVMQMTSHPYPKKIIQTPSEVIVIYEGSGTTVREIFLDGRTPAKDAEPWWNGYSTGRWEGDTLVVETVGLMDDGWLDVRGSPLTSAGKLIERFRRPNYGSLEITITVDDPKAYTKPWTVKVNQRIMLDQELIEFICHENQMFLKLTGRERR